MRILYHHRTASKDGQDVHVTEMVAALRRRGHHVKVVAPPLAGEQRVSRLRRALPRTVLEPAELAYSILAWRRLRDAYLEFQPHILYERYNLFHLAGWWLKRKTGIPWLVEVNAPLARERADHGGLAWPRLARWSERAVWQGADRVLPVTRVLAGMLKDSGVEERRIAIIPNGVDRSRFFPQAEGQALRRQLGIDGRIVLGFAGYMRPWHGLPMVLEAMAASPLGERLHFLVIGDGPARSQLEAHARRLGMANRLTCLGVVARDHMARWMSAFDVALQPKAEDYASPLKLFEYMALGKAILAPHQPNIREVLDDGSDALLFSPGDQGHFAAQLNRLCADPALRARLGAAAAQTIDRRGLTWDANAERVYELAKQLCPSGEHGALFE